MKGTKPWTYILIDNYGHPTVGADQAGIDSLRKTRPGDGSTILVSSERLLVRQLSGVGPWKMQLFVHKDLIEGGT